MARISSFLVFVTAILACVDGQPGTPAPRSAADDRAFTNAEHRLKKDLLKDYDTDVFPTRNRNHTVTAKLGMALVSMAEVREEQQTLSLNAWMRMEWQDYRLTWNPADYDDVELIRLKISSIWSPDISLYNSVNEDGMIVSNSNYLAILHSDGKVLWVPPRKLESYCFFDLTNFPYDEHECVLKFGSWTFDGFKLDLESFEGGADFGVDLTDYMLHHAWHILETTGKKNVKTYPCCPEPYPDISYTIKLKRNSRFYVHFYVSPAVMMIFLLPFIFICKPGSHVKTSLALGVIISCMLLVTVLMETPTFANRSPTIMIYYTSILILAGVCLIMSIIIDNIYFCAIKSSPPLPVRQIFITLLGKVVFVQPEDFQECSELSGNENEEEVKIDVRGGVRAQWKAVATVLSRLLFLVLTVVAVIVTMAVFA